MSGRLVLLRHGESIWNQENRFTGWTDVDLTSKGFCEAQRSACLLRANGIQPEIAFTSVLTRAIRTLWIVLDEIDRIWLPVEKDWRLNERHYGALQGLSKAETAKLYGEEKVYYWRRDFKTRPPSLSNDDPRHPRFDPRYQSVPANDLPSGESLWDTLQRVLPCWYTKISPRVAEGQTVLVSAHHNSLRALVKHLDYTSDQDIARVNIPTGFPLIYEFDDRSQVVNKYFLGEAEEVQTAADAVYRIPETILNRYWNSPPGG